VSVDYDDYKYTLVNDPIFGWSCEPFDSRLEPKLFEEIIAALRVHPSSGAYGMFLFDVIFYFYYISDYREKEKHKNQVQEAMRDAIAYFQSIFDYGVSFTIRTTTRTNSDDVGQTVKSESQESHNYNNHNS